MEIIAELEPEVRGPYAGAIGYVGYGGDLDTAIALRTIVVRKGIAYVQAAAGIVADSVGGGGDRGDRQQGRRADPCGGGGERVGSALSGQVLVIDNYDSFTFNLVQYLRELGATVAVERNDALSVSRDRARRPRAIVMSPGPRVPEEAGICVELVRELGDTIPMLGVCLGHQAIGVAYGAKVVRAPAVVHGKVGAVHHGGAGVLRGLDDPFMATRYHSLVVAEAGLPDVLEATAWSDDGLIMAMRHREFPGRGRAVSPRVRSAHRLGHALLRNFLETAGVSASAGARMSTHGGTLEAIAQRKRAEVEQLRCAEAALWAKAESLPPARELAECAARRHDHRGDEAPLTERRRAPTRARSARRSRATTPRVASPRSRC